MRSDYQATFSGLVLAGLFLLLPTSPARAADREEVTDERITLAVEHDLRASPEVAAEAIDVKTKGGVVTLAGQVYHLLARGKAQAIAENVKGVIAVVNALQVKTPLRTNEALEQDVAESLAYDPVTELYQVDVEARGGIVTLTGRVDSWQERREAERAAAAVTGVREINNRIEVMYSLDRSDEEVGRDIRARLEASACIDEGLVQARVEEGRVRLTGKVGSAAERRRAEEAAWVRGVRSVDTSGLEVAWWLRDEMCRVDDYAGYSDARIAGALERALRSDPRLGEAEPTVRVEKGIATLTGTVPSLAAKRAAREDARNTRGVWRIKNHLRVRPAEEVEDRVIEAAVENALERDPYLDRFEIEVRVVNGHVHLHGAVDTPFQARHARERAGRAEGAVAVLDHLVVVEELPRLTDWAIEEDIRDQLFWDPFLELSEIKVDVKEGKATLTGRVDTWFEWRRAQAEARAGGAEEVLNLLTVEYGPEYYQEAREGGEE